jgi:hypothetical protein
LRKQWRADHPDAAHAQKGSCRHSLAKKEKLSSKLEFEH